MLMLECAGRMITQVERRRVSSEQRPIIPFSLLLHYMLVRRGAPSLSGANLIIQSLNREGGEGGQVTLAVSDHHAQTQI